MLGIPLPKPIQAAEGSVVGAIGFSGAQGCALDEACAQAGLDAIEDEKN